MPGSSGARNAVPCVFATLRENAVAVAVPFPGLRALRGFAPLLALESLGIHVHREWMVSCRLGFGGFS